MFLAPLLHAGLFHQRSGSLRVLLFLAIPSTILLEAEVLLQLGSHSPECPYGHGDHCFCSIPISSSAAVSDPGTPPVSLIPFSRSLQPSFPLWPSQEYPTGSWFVHFSTTLTSAFPVHTWYGFSCRLLQLQVVMIHLSFTASSTMLLCATLSQLLLFTAFILDLACCGRSSTLDLA